MNLQHYFKKNASGLFKSRFSLSDEKGTIWIDTGSATAVRRYARSLGFIVPETFDLSRQWTVELEEEEEESDSIECHTPRVWAQIAAEAEARGDFARAKEAKEAGEREARNMGAE